MGQQRMGLRETHSEASVMGPTVLLALGALKQKDYCNSRSV